MKDDSIVSAVAIGGCTFSAAAGNRAYSGSAAEGAIATALLDLVLCLGGRGAKRVEVDGSW